MQEGNGSNLPLLLRRQLAPVGFARGEIFFGVDRIEDESQCPTAASGRCIAVSPMDGERVMSKQVSGCCGNRSFAGIIVGAPVVCDSL